MDDAGLLRRAVDRVLRVFVVEKTCRSCGGDGTITEERERYLDELTTTQMAFLYEAQLERTKAENGVDDSGETTQSSPSQLQQQIPGGGPSQISGGMGRPPAKGNITRF